ncbi:hypothetical protein [Lichenihabitans psoromatis]|uniref:hypothetical protein n=1 Tax=Lichenihabitans psoromatis TaxID=2528642 RepID=UPI0013F14BA4|nr:hypothetical protein [Lichenihabitans psoromatis]
MLTIIFGALILVVFGLGFGYLEGWTRDVDNSQVAEINATVMDFSVPPATVA